MAALLAAGVGGWIAGSARAEKPAESAELLGAGQVAELHRLIRPAEGESLFRTIRWHTDFWEARRIAAADGKPIYIWAGSGGGPVGVC
jgi:hypothetical protein